MSHLSVAKISLPLSGVCTEDSGGAPATCGVEAAELQRRDSPVDGSRAGSSGDCADVIDGGVLT